MANLNALLGAAKKAGIGKEEEVNIKISSDSIDISKDSTRIELLDYIMIFLCERIDLKMSVFKGGYVLTKLIPDEARLTEDIDFSVSTEGQYKDIIPVLDELGKIFVDKGIITDYEIKPTIAPTSSGGIKMSPVDGTSQIKIDIGWHDLSWGVQKWGCFGFDNNRFEIERMLSDKISAIYSRKRFRRTKDLYDFYILTNNFDVKMSVLRKYVDMRGTIEWDRDPFREEVLSEYAKAYGVLKVETRDGVGITKPAFDVIIYRLRDFMNNYNNDVVWSHVERVYKQE